MLYPLFKESERGSEKEADLCIFILLCVSYKYFYRNGIDKEFR
jgi:hypothetical protein